MDKLCEKIGTCSVPKFYRLIGKKWCYPILCNLMAGEKYSFENIIEMTHRGVPRHSLSVFLKELIDLGVLIKNKSGKYCLTDKGKLIKSKFEDIKKIMTSKCEIIEKK
ncbi:winged helix-turn-helix transcriptional regulator [Candidatus Woesearchaeota archaeon]|nr:winged helix-turn-helix transcriptional regulator [Candidatus Woesearchaeota archaeon]